MKLITRDTDYAVRALCLIAQRKGCIVSVKKLALALQLPRPFLRKILQQLNKKKILESFKGQSGGFILAKEPAKIFLTDIMRIFQGKPSLNECFLKKIVCPHTGSCPLRKKIVKIEDYVLRELGTVSIALLLRS
ncbi:MAG: Rrf2 family transcriptional regulator [Candidatus Omnitrophica bacterium]|nr:Rrf2 family transcriptional regulator [Candidatus Omnitrophota bacterium]